MGIKILRVIYTLPLVFLLFTAFSFAETGGVENVFSFGVGLRALGMGGAFTAMNNDPTLAYWNPGAMSFNQYKEISLFGTRTIADTYYFAGFYTNPTLNLGTLSIGALGIYTDGIESYDENASPITAADTNYVHYQILLSYGYNFRWGLGLGATAKIEQIKITDYRGTGASFDVGAYYNPSKLPWLSLGLVVQDVYGTGIKLDEEFEKNTRIYKAGLATNFFLTEKKKTRLSFALDSRFYTDNYNPNPGGLLYDFSFGTELAFSETLMIRAGYKNFSPQYINLPVGLSAGLGVRLRGFGIDYAVTFEDSEWQGPAELLMRIGLSYRFGKSIKELEKEREEEIQVLVDTAIEETTERYKEEIENLNMQHETDIEDLSVQHEAGIEDLNTRHRDEKQRIDKEYAVKEAALESEGQEKEEEINRLKEKREEEINRLNEEHEADVADLNTRHDRVLSGLSLDYEKRMGDEKLKSEGYARGLKFFSDGHYQEALAEFEDVAELDDNYIEVQDYIQLSMAAMEDPGSYSQKIRDIYSSGIALFVEKKYKEAIAEWEKILEEDEYNALARKNIKIAESRLKKLEELGIEE